MIRPRAGGIACTFVVPMLALGACGSSTSLQDLAPDAQADRGADQPGTEVADVAVTSDGGSGDAQPDCASVDVPSICQSPLSFPARSSTPTMCPGRAWKTAQIPFDPTDSRWSALYWGCLANYESSDFYQCGQLCTEVAATSSALKYSLGIKGCSLDCSHQEAPVLSVEYSEDSCEPPPTDVGSTSPKLDARSDAASDLGIDGARAAGIDGPPDSTAVLDAGEAGRGLQVVLSKAYAWANCMPSISADPILVTWTVDITGARGSTARLTKATIAVSGSTSIVQDFTVDNPTISLAHGAGTADQRKPVAVVTPTYRLDLAYDIDGQSIPTSKSGSFTCAY
jgi:hypothetical protein